MIKENEIPISIIKLSELQKQINTEKSICKSLPCLCKKIQKTKKGRQTCQSAIDKLNLLAKKCGENTFTSCCYHAIKVIPIRLDDNEVYLIYTRNIVPDHVHLNKVAKLINEPFNDVLKLWESIPAISKEFIEYALKNVEKYVINDADITELSNGQKDLLQRQGENLKIFASIYEKRFPHDHPAFDVMIYNMLNTEENYNYDCEGIIKTNVGIKTEDGPCVMRLVLKNIGQNKEEPPLPIIGMALANCKSNKSCIENNNIIKEFEEILLSEWYDSKFKEPYTLSAYNGQWESNLEICSNKKPEETDIDEIILTTEIAINMATNTIGGFLLDKLKKDRAHFIELIDRIISCKVDSFVGLGSRILWFQVLEDIKYVFKTYNLKLDEDVLQGIFQIVEESSPLVPPIKQIDKVKRRKLLLEDFFDKEQNLYKKEIDTGSILSNMEVSKGDKSQLKRIISRCGNDSISGFSEFIKSIREKGDISTEANVWEVANEFCGDSDQYGVLINLYESTLPEKKKFRYYLGTEALGMIITGITGGFVPWNWVAEKRARNKAIKFAQQKTQVK